VRGAVEKTIAPTQRLTLSFDADSAMLPINSVQNLVRCTPSDLPTSAEVRHSPSVPGTVVSDRHSSGSGLFGCHTFDAGVPSKSCISQTVTAVRKRTVLAGELMGCPGFARLNLFAVRCD
jgi:hypothetical protein